MVLSVVALSGPGMAANTARGDEVATYNPGVGGPNQVVVSEERTTVFRGEDDVDFVDANGSEIEPSRLIGTAGDAEGIPLESPIPEDQALGQYAINGEQGEIGVTVQQPRVTDLELLNELGADVADSSVPEDEVILVRAEWNFKNAEDLDINVFDENGNEVTGDVLTTSDELSEAQLSELNGAYAENPAAVGNPGQRGTGTEVVYLQGVGQFNETQLNNTSVDDAFWALDLSNQNAGEYTITVEGWDELDFDTAQQSVTLDVTTEDEVMIDVEDDEAARGAYVDYTIRGSSAGNQHYVTIEDDDFRNNRVDANVFRDVEDVLERGTVDSDGDGTAEFAYARVIIDEATGLGEGQIDTTFLDDTNVDVNVFERGLSLEEVTATLGDEEDNDELRVTEGQLSISAPFGTYIAGDEVDVSGTAQAGIDDVALYARDQGEWELLDTNEDGTLDSDDLIPVDRLGEWEERDVRLSIASDILAIPGRYRLGVIEAEDALDENGNVQATLSTTEFSSGASEQTTILVTEPGLGAANQSSIAAAGEFGGLDTGDESLFLSAQQLGDVVLQQEASNTAQRPLIYQSYNGQVATDDGTVDVLGTAPGQDDVLLIMVDTRGRVATDQVTVDDDGVFEEDDISISTPDGRELNEGNIAAFVYALGRDTVAGDGIIPGEASAGIGAVENYVQSFSGRGLTQTQVLEIFLDETVDEPGSDDLIVRDSFRYNDGSTTIETIRQAGSNATGVNQIEAGETMEIVGVTNRKPDDNTVAVDVTQGPDFTQIPSGATDEWDFTGQWSISIDVPEDTEPGTYTIEADDGDNTDIVTFEVVPATDEPTETPDNETEDNETDTDVPSVTLSDQSSDGASVVVESATLPDGGYIVLHDNATLANDTLGSVVGASAYLEAGSYENLTVEFDAAINESGSYVAMLHRDTNGNQTFDFVSSNASVDFSYLVDGAPVVDAGEVTVEAENETVTGEN